MYIDKQTLIKARIDKRCITKDTGNLRLNEFRKHFALEGLFAFTIVAMKQAVKFFSQIVVHKAEQQTVIALLEKLHVFLTDGRRVIHIFVTFNKFRKRI